jgi:hypothetical protein
VTKPTTHLAPVGETCAPPALHDGRDIALVDLLDRLLAGGVVIAAEITLGIADVDLVHISLHALVETIRAGRPEAGQLRAADEG